MIAGCFHFFLTRDFREKLNVIHNGIGIAGLCDDCDQEWVGTLSERWYSRLIVWRRFIMLSEGEWSHISSETWSREHELLNSPPKVSPTQAILWESFAFLTASARIGGY